MVPGRYCSKETFLKSTNYRSDSDCNLSFFVCEDKLLIKHINYFFNEPVLGLSLVDNINEIKV